MNNRNLAIIIIALSIFSSISVYYYLIPKGTSIELSINKSVITIEENILVTLTITNLDRETKTYDISPPAFDILVYHENGTLWARYTDGKAFPEIYIQKNLTRGESYQKEYLWNLFKFDQTTLKFIKPQPGIYLLEGVFRSTPNLKTGKIRIEIESRT